MMTEQTMPADADIAPQRRGKRWVVVAFVLVVAGFFLWQSGAFDGGAGNGTYQAVFLTNDQVYFGKVRNETAQYVSLTDIYYLRAAQQLQPPNQQAAPTLELVKLGNELHGPEDEMRVNRDHILFIEDLKESSQVVDAIEKSRGQQERNEVLPPSAE